MCVGVGVGMGVGVGGREGGWIVIRLDRGGKREFSNNNFKPFLPLFQQSLSGQTKMENINIHFKAVHNYYHRKSMVLGGSNLEESLPYEMRHSVGSCNIL